jgi:hypothetical protein
LDPADDAAELLADYVAAEDALRAFTDRNFGRMCAICARWTLFAAQVNAAAGEDEGRKSKNEMPHDDGGEIRPSSAVLRPQGPVGWRLQSWVTNCCNANHALESMSDDSLAGIVASREEGRQWWRKVARAAAAPCAALTDTGCALKRGRPELCNRYFCEAVRDYLWTIGGERHGPRLAAQLDHLQKRWAALYLVYQRAILEARQAAGAGTAGEERRTEREGGEARRLTNVRYRRRRRVRAAAQWGEFFVFLKRFEAEIAAHVRPVRSEEMTARFFKVNGERDLYAPFFAREIDAIGGRIRSDAG